MVASSASALCRRELSETMRFHSRSGRSSLESHFCSRRNRNTPSIILWGQHQDEVTLPTVALNQREAVGLWLLSPLYRQWAGLAVVEFFRIRHWLCQVDQAGIFIGSFRPDTPIPVLQLCNPLIPVCALIVLLMDWKDRTPVLSSVIFPPSRGNDPVVTISV